MLVEDLLKHFQKHDWDWCKKHSIELTPQILRLTSQTKGLHYFLNLYLNFIPLKNIDVNVIRQFKNHLRYIIPSIMECESEDTWKRWKIDNQTLYDQFFKPWEDIVISFKKTKHKK